jgi:hypothetical protein
MRKMKRAILPALLLIASSNAITADSVETLHAYARESSFTMTVPAGWKVNWKAEAGQVVGGRRGGGRVFELESVSPDTKAQSVTIYASFYRNVVPSAARQEWEGSFAGQSTELAPIAGLSRWMLVEAKADRMKTLTAYASLGWDTLYIWFNAANDFSATNDALYDQARRALLEMLKSYKEDKVFSGP